ncbi:hypothetical protein [Limnobacter parvus]|uniref:Uncharacterized protein n=1 Tax=Limnobacter parvus TaxID=2939690 RepID=A0ABT1XKB8_9BURK|nr:hypothetical protein [Limnobacter parvus]MCR2747309.1 hypothetical protein [Limnobacter parvus]
MINASAGSAAPNSSAPVCESMQGRNGIHELNQLSPNNSSTRCTAHDIFVWSGLSGAACVVAGPGLALSYNVILGGVISGLAVLCCSVACYNRNSTEDDPNMRDPNFMLD